MNNGYTNEKTFKVACWIDRNSEILGKISQFKDFRDVVIGLHWLGVVDADGVFLADKELDFSQLDEFFNEIRDKK